MSNVDIYKILREFLPDLLTTFPEYKDNLNKGLLHILEENYDTEDVEHVTRHLKNVFPERFFDIVYQNEDIFYDTSCNTEFLPNINFNELWNQDISQHTKDIIWKYLQLLLFSIMPLVKNLESFGDTAKLFEAINEDEFRNKLEETMKNMQHMFDVSTINLDGLDSSTNIDLSNLPNPNDIHNHINSMLGGKLGNLAREIAEETAEELNLDLNEDSDMNDIFKKMFRNPGKLMNMVQSIGTKLEDKIKSGNIKESELIQEATEMMSKMENMPGMDHIQKMFGSMGLPGMKHSNIHNGAFKNHMMNNLKQSQQRERMLKKLEERKNNKGKIIFDESTNNYKFTTGEIVEKSSIHKNKQRKKKNKKKQRK